MRKILPFVVVIMVVLLAGQMRAQKAGFKLGLNFANSTLKDDEGNTPEYGDKKALISPRLGFSFEMPIHESFFIGTGVFTTVKGFKYKSWRGVGDIWEGTYKEVEVQDFFIMWYVELPIHLGYKLELDRGLYLFGMAGPVLGYNVYTTDLYKKEGQYTNEKIAVGNTDTSLVRPLEIGFNIEAGIQWQRFQLSMFCNPGVSNVFAKTFADAGGSWKNFNFGINLGILFGKMDDGRRGRGRWRR